MEIDFGDVKESVRNSINISNVWTSAGKACKSKKTVNKRKILRCEMWFALVPGANACVCLLLALSLSIWIPAKEGKRGLNTRQDGDKVGGGDYSMFLMLKNSEGTTKRVDRRRWGSSRTLAAYLSPVCSRERASAQTMSKPGL